MFKDMNKFSPIAAITPVDMVTRCKAALRAESVRNINLLLLLVKASRGELEPIQIADAPEDASDFILKQLEEKARAYQKEQLDEAVEAAMELAEIASGYNNVLTDEIKDLESKLRELKKNKKKLNKAQEFGKATSNYLPLATLLVHPTVIKEVNIEKSWLEIPKAPKVIEAIK